MGASGAESKDDTDESGDEGPKRNQEGFSCAIKATRGWMDVLLMGNDALATRGEPASIGTMGQSLARVGAKVGGHY